MQVTKFKNIHSTLLKFSNHLGNVGTVSLSKHKKVGIINNILVYPHLRKHGYGSQMVGLSEEFLKENDNITEMKLIAWQTTIDPVCEFYLKNGYVLDKENTTYYDDGLIEHSLVPMRKTI